MKDFTEYILKNSFIFGVVFTGGSLILFIIMLLRKESPRMKDHDVMSWEAYVYQWALIAMMFVLGLSLLFE